MLQQDRINLHADAKATSATLLDREIAFIRSDMKTIATISSFLGGFLYRQVSTGADPRKNAFEAGSLEVLIIAFMLNLLGVVTSVMLQVFGPYAALKAKPIELQGVIRKIRSKRRVVLRLFLSGLVSFELSTLALIWARWRTPFAIVATAIIGIFDVYMHRVYHGMVKAFNVPSFIPSSCANCCGSAGNVNAPGTEPSDVMLFNIDYEKMEDGPADRMHEDNRCLQCSAQVPKHAKFCNVCGSLAPHRCLECFELLDPSCKFCSSCGSKQKSKGVKRVSRKQVSGANHKQQDHQGAGGWLRRQTKFGGQWRNFYFVLTGSTLQKFDRPQGTLIREYVVETESADIIDLPGRGFKVPKNVKGAEAQATGKQKYLYLQALSDDSKQTWMQALRPFVRQIHKSNTTDLDNVESDED